MIVSNISDTRRRVITLRLIINNDTLLPVRYVERLTPSPQNETSTYDDRFQTPLPSHHPQHHAQPPHQISPPSGYTPPNTGYTPPTARFTPPGQQITPPGQQPPYIGSIGYTPPDTTGTPGSYPGSAYNLTPYSGLHYRTSNTPTYHGYNVNQRYYTGGGYPASIDTTTPYNGYSALGSDRLSPQPYGLPVEGTPVAKRYLDQSAIDQAEPTGSCQKRQKLDDEGKHASSPTTTGTTTSDSSLPEVNLTDVDTGCLGLTPTPTATTDTSGGHVLVKPPIGGGGFTTFNYSNNICSSSSSCGYS